MNLSKENIIKIMFLVIFTLVIAFCVFNFSYVLYYINIAFAVVSPILIGGTMAFIINVPMKFIEKYGFKNKLFIKNRVMNKIARPMSLLLSILFILGIIYFVIRIVVPDLYTTIINIGNNITAFLPEAIVFVSKYIDNETIEKYFYSLMSYDWTNILLNSINAVTVGAGNVISTTLNMVSSVMSTTFNIFMSFIFSVYILLQKEKLLKYCNKAAMAFLSHRNYRKMVYVVDLTYKTFSSYVTGQCLDACILGFMFFVVLSISGMPYPMLIGVVIGFTAIIPMVGCFLGCALSFILIFMISPTQSIIFLIIFIILQQLEETLIYPKVVGKSVGLPSILVLVAVTVGGSLWGVIGMIVLIPLTSVAYTLFNKLVNKKLRNKNLRIAK